MGRHIDYTSEKIEKLLAEGRGQGAGAEYVPWIKVDDFPSSGRGNRVPDPMNGRIHHFFSDLEMRFFYILLWDDRNTDIREQYPLDWRETKKIADQLGITHSANQDGSPFVMTTDFLVTRENTETGEKSFHAYAVKRMSDLENNKRVLDKLQIEQKYWEAKRIHWKLITEEDVSTTKANNIRKLMSHYSDEELSTNILLKQWLLLALSENQQMIISAVCKTVDQKYGLEGGSALRLFFHLAARKEITVDISMGNLVTKEVASVLDMNEVLLLVKKRSEVDHAG